MWRPVLFERLRFSRSRPLKRNKQPCVQCHNRFFVGCRGAVYFLTQHALDFFTCLHDTCARCSFITEKILSEDRTPSACRINNFRILCRNIKRGYAPLKSRA